VFFARAARNTTDVARPPLWTVNPVALDKRAACIYAPTQAAHSGAFAAVHHTLLIDPSGESSWIDPELMDLMLTDIDEEQLRSGVAEKLGVQYLARASAAGMRFPVRGAVYGRLERVMVSLVVVRQATGVAVHIIFLVDTGSAYTYLSPAAYAALGYTDSLPKAVELNVHGVAVIVSPSRAHFTDVNVLGQDFFRDGGVDLVVQHSRSEKAVWLLRPARRGR
jgi:PAS domain-containing protein